MIFLFSQSNQAANLNYTNKFQNLMRSKMSSILNSNCLINSEKEFINDSDKTRLTNVESEQHKNDISVEHSQIDTSSYKCSKCEILEIKVKELQLKIKKLTSQKANEIIPRLSQTPNQLKSSKNSKANSPSMNQNNSPYQLRKLNYNFNLTEDVLQNQRKLLIQIQQRAEKLCKKQRKEREILKHIIQSKNPSENNSPTSHNQVDNYTQRSSIIQSPSKQSHMRVFKSKSQIRPAELEIQKINEGKSIGIVKQKKILDIPSSILIQQIPQRQEAKPTLLSKIECDSIQQYFSQNEDKIKEDSTPKNENQQRKKLFRTRKAESMDVSLLSECKSQISNMSSEEVDTLYKNKMRDTKLMAKFKRKK